MNNLKPITEIAQDVHFGDLIRVVGYHPELKVKVPVECVGYVVKEYAQNGGDIELEPSSLSVVTKMDHLDYTNLVTDTKRRRSRFIVCPDFRMIVSFEVIVGPRFIDREYPVSFLENIVGYQVIQRANS